MNSQTVVFLATVALFAVSVEGHEGFTLPGKYEMVTKSDDAKFAEYLKAIGVPAEPMKKIQGAQKVEVWIRNPTGENWEVERKNDGQSAVTLKFESGREFDTVRADGVKVKNTITVNRRTHTAHRVVPVASPARYATTDVDFIADKDGGGFTATLRCGEKSAVLKFTRVGKTPRE